MSCSPPSSAGRTSSGGSAVALGAVIQRSADVAVNTADPLPFNTVFSDVASYWDAGNGRFLIPTGRDGLYIYGAKVFTATGGTPGLTSLKVTLSVGGNAANGIVTGANFPSGGNPRFFAAGAFVDVFLGGDTITPSWTLDGVAVATMAGGNNGSTFYIGYLGPLS